MPRAALGLLLLATAGNPALGSTLLGEAPFQGTRDLNIIRTDDDRTLEFLDFFPTRKLSLETALATYAPFGFRLANEVDVSQLFSAFGFTYAFTTNTYTPVTDMTSAERDHFLQVMSLSILSPQSGVKAMYANSQGYAATSYFCIGIPCSPNAFTNDVHIDGILDTSTTLVRDAIVPLPPAAWLGGSALVLLGAVRRRPAAGTR